MKILHIITGLGTGGAERALWQLLQGGLSQQFQSCVVSLGDAGTIGPLIRETGVPVFTLDMREGASMFQSVVKLRKIVRQFCPDIVQGWMYHGNLAASIAPLLASQSIPTIWNVRQSLYDLNHEKTGTRIVIKSNRFLSGRPNSIIYNSSISRNQHELFGFASKRGQVIPNGFDLDKLCPNREAGLAVRHDLGIPADATVIGHIARFHPMKDHRRFVRTAVRITKAHSDVHILLGGLNVTPANQTLYSLIPERLRARFRWLGERNDVINLMRSMDLFCLSSAWGEAFPNVLGEAMAAGVPCVTTEVGDSAQIVADTGVVVPPNNDDALFNGLMEMLNHLPNIQRTLGESARMRIKKNYSLDAVVNQYIELYENITVRKRNGENK